MATRSGSSHHSYWSAVADPTELPNVSGATIQDSAVEVGDTCFSISDSILYVCTTATVGAAVWETTSGDYWQRSGTTLSPTTSGDVVKINADGAIPSLQFLREDNPGVSAVNGRLYFRSNNSTPTDTSFACIDGKSLTLTAGAEEGLLLFYCADPNQGGSLTAAFVVQAGGNVTYTYGQAPDFRIRRTDTHGPTSNVGDISFEGRDTAGMEQYGRIRCYAYDDGTAHVDGSVQVYTNYDQADAITLCGEFRNGQFQAVDGTVSAPSISFASDTDCGLFYDTGIGITVGGTQIGEWTSQGLGIPDGSSGSPSVYFRSDSNSGIFRPGADEVAVVSGGGKVVSFEKNVNDQGKLNIYDTGATAGTGAAIGYLSFLANSDNPTERIFARFTAKSDSESDGAEEGSLDVSVITSGSLTQVAEFNSTGLAVVVDGDAATPAVAIGTSATTGFYAPSTDTLGLSFAGTQYYVLKENGLRTVTSGGFYLRRADGTAASPTYAFYGTLDTGMYLDSTDVAFSVGGSKVAHFDSGGLQVVDGSESAPSVSFTGATNYGMYYETSRVRFTANGSSSFAVGIGHIQIEREDSYAYMRSYRTGASAIGPLWYRYYYGVSDASPNYEYARQYVRITDKGSGTESAEMTYYVSDAGSLKASLILRNGQTVVPNGSASEPGMAFSNEAGTGFSYLSGAIVVSSAGYKIADFDVGTGGTDPGELNLYDSGGTASGDGVDLAQINFVGWDSGNAQTDFAQIAGVSELDNAGFERGEIDFAITIGGSLTDVAKMRDEGAAGYPGWYNEVQTVTSNSNQTAVDLANGFHTYQQLSEDTTYQKPSNPIDGQILSVILRQLDGNSYTVSFTTDYLLAGNSFNMTAPDAHNAVDVLRFVYSSTLSSWIEISRTQDCY